MNSEWNPNAPDDTESYTTVRDPVYGGSFTTDRGPELLFVLPQEQVRPNPLTILEPSPQRVPPACDHFGICGGCHYQHAAYETQLELKRDILHGLLGSAGLMHLPEIEFISGSDYQYRNRIRLRVEHDAAGDLRYGYTLRALNTFLPIHMCPISAPVLLQSMQAILQLGRVDPLVARWLAITSEVELLCTHDQFQLQVRFFLRTPEAGKREASIFDRVCEHIRTVAPQLTGASALPDPEQNRRARRAWNGVTWGAPGFNYSAAGRSYWLPRAAFFQVNRFLVDPLVELVAGGKSGALAWDLYAGVGLFTRALAESFKQVIAVEGAEIAITSLRGGKHVDAIHSTTLDFLHARELQRERPDLVVFDPPRAGLGIEGAALLARIAASRMVYVSCDPTTLARDLTILSNVYRIDKVHLVDLFPQTFHIETVVHLTRR